MKWSELPIEYKSLENTFTFTSGTGEEIILNKMAWHKTAQSCNFWEKAHKAKNIIELPEIPNVLLVITSNYNFYYKGESILFRTNDILVLAGIKMSECTNKTPVYFKGDIIRIDNAVLSYYTKKS